MNKNITEVLKIEISTINQKVSSSLFNSLIFVIISGCCGIGVLVSLTLMIILTSSLEDKPKLQYKPNNNQQAVSYTKHITSFKDIFDTPYGKGLIKKGKEYFNLKEETIRKMNAQQLQDLAKAINKYENNHTIIHVPNPIPNLPSPYDPKLPGVPQDPNIILPPIEDHPDYPNNPKPTPPTPKPKPKPHPPTPEDPKKPKHPNPSKKSSSFGGILTPIILLISGIIGTYFYKKQTKTIKLDQN